MASRRFRKLHRKKLLNTRRDSLDFRDRLYQPALVALRSELFPDRKCLHVRDQGQEGACTGFGLAAMIDYLNLERGVAAPVSARMLYEMAKRHDQWPGHDYEGSTARGAMKGWHKNGVCREKDWTFDRKEVGFLDARRQEAALAFPLGAYYRIMPRRSDFHAALSEVHAVFVTAATHDGWEAVDAKGRIPWNPKRPADAGHAFAIVGYDADGFIVQNSWGEGWGGLKLAGKTYKGCALWLYEDFEANLWDAWVARTALPVKSLASLSPGWIADTVSGAEPVQKAPPRHEIRDHYVHIDDGQFDPVGDYPSQEDEVREAIGRVVGSGARHLLFYAHGGLNDIKECAARAGAWKDVCAANGIHALHFIWETGLMAELGDILLGKESFAKERVGGFGDWWDRQLERAAAPLGHALWMEMQADARRAFEPEAAGSATLKMLLDALKGLPEKARPRLHLAGHSAGSIWHARLLDRWKVLGGPPIESLVLLAPAATVALFHEAIEPALASRRVGALHHFLLTDELEQDDDVALLYRKSLLYLVSRSFEHPHHEVPILGMQRFWNDVVTSLPPAVRSRVKTSTPPTGCNSKSHGGFDNDLATMNALLGVVLGATPARLFTKEDLSGY